MKDEPMAFLITRGCGCWVQSIVDEPHRDDTNTILVMDALRDGYTVRHVTLDAARAAVNRTCADD